MNKTYKSAVDRWLIPLLAVGLLFPAAIVLWAAVVGSTTDLGVGLISALFTAAIFRGLVFPLYYTLNDDHLLIHFGMIKQRTPYDQIVGAHYCSSIISSPALSTQRIQIDVRAKMGVMISPTDRSAFLDDLAERVPGARREGERLIVG